MSHHALPRGSRMSFVNSKLRWRSSALDAHARHSSSESSHAAIPDDHEIDPATKTISTTAGPLPISPLMDDSFITAKRKWSAPKARPAANTKLKWQRHLARNPYAKALATPIRACAVTKVTLPNYFLQGFHLTQPPDSPHPWWVPEDLAPRQSEEVMDEEVQPPDTPTLAPQEADPPRGGTGYFLARESLLREFSDKSSAYRQGNKRLLRNKTPAIPESVLNNAVWRSDMDTFITELMRRRIVEGLLFLTQLCKESGRKYLTRCETWEEVKELKHRGCVLFLEAPNNTSPVQSLGSPGRLSVMDIPDAKFGSKLVVYNLGDLLGEEHGARLREQSEMFRDGSLFMLGRARTVGLQLKLWKLQGYLARDSPKSEP